MGSKVGVDIIVDWDLQVLHAPVFEAVGMIAGSVDDVCYVMAFECTGIQASLELPTHYNVNEFIEQYIHF